MAVKIQLRRGTQAQFNSASLDPLDGEVFLVQVNDSDDTGGYLVVGDGTRSWETLRDDVDARVYFEPGYSQTVMGGEQPAGSTPLTVKGATSQTAAILKVTNKGDNSILEIYDDEGPTVRLEDHGDVGEVFVQLKQQASQTANALELHDHGDNDQLTISCDGEVAITPTNNQTADAPSLDVKGSAATQSNGILRVKDGSNNTEFTVSDGGVAVTGTSALDGNVTGKAITTIQNGADATDRVVIKGLDTGNVIEVFENDVSQFVVDATGKVVADDIEIDATGRTPNDATILRADEIYARIVKQVAPFTFGVQGALAVNTNVTTTERLVKLTGSDGDNARKLNSSDPENVGSAFTLESASADTTVPETSTADDQTNPYFVKVPANSGPFTIMANVYYLGANITTKIYQYTSDAAESTGRVTVATDTSGFNTSGASNAEANDYSLLQLTANVANETTDKFYAVSFVTDSIDGTDEIMTDGVDPVIFALHDEHVNSANTTNQPDGTRQLLTFFRGTPTTGSAVIYRAD